MSRLDELIKELCPNGVEYKRFYEVAQYVRGVTYGKGQEINNGGDGYKLLRANNITLSSNTLNFDDVKVISRQVHVKDSQMLKKGDILICAGSGSKEHIGKVAYISKNMNYTYGGFMGVIRTKQDIMQSSFMFHILTGSMFKRHLKKVSGASSSTINNINNDTWRNFKLPVPPLEVQREIVRILDNFTLLTAELTAELTARRKQYEFYRDKLLTYGNDRGGNMGKFDELIEKMCPNGVEYKTLSELFNTRNGYTPSKSNPKFWEKGTIPWFRMEDIRENGRILSSALQYVSESAVKGSPFPANSIIVATSATIGEHALITVPSLANQRFTYLMLKEQYKDVFDIKFLYYYCFKLDDYCKKCLNQGNFASVDMKKFIKFAFPLIPLEVQQRLVNVLDNFESFCSDLNIGLPAEIEARQKQYEYYRDALLTYAATGKTILTDRQTDRQTDSQTDRR